MKDKIVIKNHIINTTASLFLTNGYTKTTTKEIAKACNITEGSLFRLFKDKESILFEIINLLIESNVINLKDNFNEYTQLSTMLLIKSDENEILKDLLLNLFSLKSTKTYINKHVATLLSTTLKIDDYELKEYYELVIAINGMYLNYLDLNTDMYFTIKKKTKRYLEILLYLLKVNNYNINTIMNIDYQNKYNDLINSINLYLKNKGGNN